MPRAAVTPPNLQPTMSEPPVAAREAGLRYVRDDAPGLRRRRQGKGFRFLEGDGRPVRDRATLVRIRALAIPPAWTDVWICPSPVGHIQAVGRDARGRKQYRYHARWRQRRDEAKYDRMIAFANSLPKIRARVRRDLGRPGLPREKVLATVVSLLEATLIRVGNDEYARQNRSYGLTTMKDRHVGRARSRLELRFQGKGGKTHAVGVEDKRLSRIVTRCQDLPGEELFQYVDDDGRVCDIESGDVNGYLRTISGRDFTAKDFRTWAGTVLAACALQDRVFRSASQARKNVLRAIEDVAGRLGNTAAICRKSYVHPAVLEGYLDGTLIPARFPARATKGGALSAAERAVLAFLRRSLDS